MKSLIKNISIASMAITSFFLYSCGGNSNEYNTAQDTKKTAEEHNDAKFEKGAESDAQFLVNASSINFEEIQLGNLAATKANNSSVKNLGESMAEVHTQAQNELANLARKKGITVPVSAPDESLKDYDILKAETSKNFDNKFTDMMIDGHKDAIAIFVKASTESEDADIRDWAAKMLPQLRTHLDHAMNCKENLRAEK